MSCTTPINQPIYQALIDKANSYPADKAYQAKAYKTAAESVRTWNYNLYNDYIPAVPGVGASIQKFIEEFIQTNSSSDSPRRSTRLAAKAPAPKPIPKSVPKPVAKPAFDPARYFPEEKKASTAVCVISTYGFEDCYERNGYELYRAKDKFEIICVDHCSCADTIEIVESYDEDEYKHTFDDIIRLATAKSDPRVPDVATEDPHLIALYASILEHKDELLTWNPTKDEESLDNIEVYDPEWKHKF
jgi:hypothetical protein